jgi:hypothetical protein
MRLRPSWLRLKMGLVVIGLWGIAAPHAQESGNGKAVDLLLVLAVDVSDSINEKEAWLQRYGYADALSDPLIIAAIKGGRRGSIAVTYLEWAGPGEQHQVMGWTRIDSAESARAAGAALKAAPVSGGYWTSISGALDRAVKLVAAAPFEATRRVIDLSSDGRNNAGAPLAGARQRALGKGITINGLPVLIMRRNFSFPPMPNLDRYFSDCVIGGPGAFSIVVENYKDLAVSVRRKMIREIAGTFSAEGRVRPVAGKPGVPKFDCREEPPHAGRLPQAG